MAETVKKFYELRKDIIKRRLEDFKAPKTEDEIFSELCFCLLTPQSKAKSCWKAVTIMKENRVLYSGSEENILEHIREIRFLNNKAKYLVLARSIFPEIKKKLEEEKNPAALREYLVQNVKGYGYKEASHFLRNIGITDIGILDRHILNNLVKYGVIEEIPKSLTPKKYFEIEEKMRKFSENLGIPFDELDLLFWSMQTGEVFK